MNNESVRGSMDSVPSTTESTVTLDRQKDSDEYNPFKHRELVHPTSTLGAFFHLLKSSLGTGLLAMPAAFRNSGLIPGCIGTVLVAVIATHCVHILVSTSRQICKESKEPSLSYTDTCERVFTLGPRKLKQYSKHIRYFADSAMAGVCLGGTSVYVIFIASSLKDLFDGFYPENKYEVKAYCGMLLFPLIIITQIRHLKFLVPFSVIANVCLVLIFGVTCNYTFRDLQPIENVSMATGIDKWPLFLSTAIFAMEGINVVMPVENEMGNPEHFLGCPGVLNVTMVFVATLYGIVGILGYLKYGENVLGSITLNLPQDEILAVTAKVLVAIAVFFTYCLQMYAPMDIIWTRIKHRISERYHNIGQISLRTFSVGLTVVLAVAVPDLELLIGLVGAIFFSTLGLLIPAVVQTVYKWDRGLGKYNYIIFKNAFLLVIYIIVLVSGCYTAINAIIAKYR